MHTILPSRTPSSQATWKTKTITEEKIDSIAIHCYYCLVLRRNNWAGRENNLSLGKQRRGKTEKTEVPLRFMCEDVQKRTVLTQCTSKSEKNNRRRKKTHTPHTSEADIKRD